MSIPKATHSGDLKISNIVLSCYVLSDGQRILSQRGVMSALGRSGKQRGGKNDADKLPPFLSQNNLKPYITKELVMATNPIRFKAPSAGKLVYGYLAEILPLVCEVYLEARDAGALLQSQAHIAKQAEMIVRAFAHVGIIALIDEATGYQEIRDRKALEKILDERLKPYAARWAKRFPDDFYKEIFRLKDWSWEGMHVNRPQVVGHYTNDVVYARLADGLLERLQKLNPKDDSGERTCRHHQWLTEQLGVPELHEHIIGVMAIMRSVRLNNTEQAWNEFKRSLQRSYPKKNINFDLDFDG